MKNYLQFISEGKENKNLHLSHLEDLVIEGGVLGCQNAIEFLRSLRDMLKGHTDSSVNITTKWDGSPSLFAGINPENGKFFVATKSLFNATAKLNYTEQDIDTNHPGTGLANKLKAALKYLPDLNMHGIYQGDILFTHEDLKSERIMGVNYTTFQPNTIVYAVPTDSKIGRTIQSAQLGIVWHTQYTGKKIAELKASFGANISNFRTSRNVWSQTATFNDVSGSLTFTKKEAELVDSLMTQIGQKFQQINSRFLNELHSNSTYSSYISVYNNSKIRSGEKISNVDTHIRGLNKFIEDKWNKEILSAKQEDTKRKRSTEKSIAMRFFQNNISNLRALFDLQNAMIDAKIIIIRKLESAEVEVKHFVRDSDGIKITAPEGFVAIDNVGKAVKLVDRLTFSHKNFTVLKNWKI